MHWRPLADRRGPPLPQASFATSSGCSSPRRSRRADEAARRLSIQRKIEPGETTIGEGREMPGRHGGLARSPGLSGFCDHYAPVASANCIGPIQGGANIAALGIRLLLDARDSEHRMRDQGLPLVCWARLGGTGGRGRLARKNCSPASNVGAMARPMPAPRRRTAGP